MKSFVKPNFAIITILLLSIFVSVSVIVHSDSCDYCCNLDFLYQNPFFCNSAIEDSACTFTYDGVYSACCGLHGYSPCEAEFIGSNTAYFRYATGYGDCEYACGDGPTACVSDFVITDQVGDCVPVGELLSHPYSAFECTGGNGNQCF